MPHECVAIHHAGRPANSGDAADAAGVRVMTSARKWRTLIRRGRLALSLGGLLLLVSAMAAVAESRIAVVYPDIGEPYRSVFEQIIAGVEEKARTRVASFAVGPSTDINEFKSSLQRQNIGVVIALGQQGMKVAAVLERDIGVVVGGIISPPENMLRDVPVNSLSPDPALLFAQLKELMPAARRVFVVYDPRQNGWLVRAAKEAARAQGVELVAYEVQDLRGAARTYLDIFNGADMRRDAVWLLADSISAENGTVLPLVLQESWSRNLTVFSSSIGHVRRGALFSLYPDNVAMGRRLGDAAQAFLAAGNYGAQGTILLREVLLAFNVRTADHLGLKPGRKLNPGMVFPEQ